jgi:hypothetical protein
MAELSDRREHGLFHPDHLVMGVVISVLAWGGLKLVAIGETQAAIKKQQVYDASATRRVETVIPVVRELDNKMDGVLCMLKFEPHLTTERMACLQQVINK